MPEAHTGNIDGAATETGEFSMNFGPDEFAKWLSKKYVPQGDCDIIKGQYQLTGFHLGISLWGELSDYSHGKREGACTCLGPIIFNSFFLAISWGGGGGGGGLGQFVGGVSPAP